MSAPAPAKSAAGGAVALSIVIATYDRYPFLRDAIAAVERQTLDAAAYELIVVDNSSDREAQSAFLADLAVECQCDYAIEELPGVARARNIGVRLARGEIVAFIDDDSVPDPAWAEAIVTRFARMPAVGVMGGPVGPIWAAKRPPWLPSWADHMLSALDHGPHARTLAAHEHLISANMAVRKAALVAAGGFPEHLGRRGSALLSNCEISLRYAVVARGWAAFYDPAMSVRHHVHRDRLSQAWLRRRMAWQAVSDLIEGGGEVDGEARPDEGRLRELLGIGAGGDGLAALFATGRSPDEVSAQMGAVRLLMRLLLATPGDGGA